MKLENVFNPKRPIYARRLTKKGSDQIVYWPPQKKRPEGWEYRKGERRPRTIIPDLKSDGWEPY